MKFPLVSWLRQNMQQCNKNINVTMSPTQKIPSIACRLGEIQGFWLMTNSIGFGGSALMTIYHFIWEK